jgi:hypothetical protein
MCDGASRTFEWKHPMIDENPVKPADADISPYLQQPLRTLKAAQQDQKRRQCEAADIQTKTKRPD